MLRGKDLDRQLRFKMNTKNLMKKKMLVNPLISVPLLLHTSHQDVMKNAESVASLIEKVTLLIYMMTIFITTLPVALDTYK